MSTQPPAAALARNEFALISELSEGEIRTQRQLSQQTGLSLGMTNLLLKRLMRKGYVKAKQLTWNKTQYLLTVRGSLEKARKSYAYAHFIWDQARKISDAIQTSIIREYRDGVREAVVVAWPETASLIRKTLAEKDLPGLELRFVDGFKYVPADATTVFTATVEPAPASFPAGQRVVPLLDRVDLQFKFD
jgi:hypothetical protein